MGFRTIVVFNNDRASDWEMDPTLGRKIIEDMHGARNRSTSDRLLSKIGAKVASCEHSDQRYLALVDYLDVVPSRELTPDRLGESRQMLLVSELKRLAEANGYRLVKSRAKKAAP